MTAWWGRRCWFNCCCWLYSKAQRSNF